MVPQRHIHICSQQHAVSGIHTSACVVPPEQLSWHFNTLVQCEMTFITWRGVVLNFILDLVSVPPSIAVLNQLPGVAASAKEGHLPNRTAVMSKAAYFAMGNKQNNVMATHQQS